MLNEKLSAFTKSPLRLLLPLVLVAAFAAVLWLRLGSLGDKPLHADESEQAYTLSRLLSGEGYHYDPVEHHGPVMYYLAALVCKLAGQNSFGELSATVLRIIPAVFGLVLVAAPLLWRRCGVCVAAAGVAVLLGATSPLAVYYARYFVQETLFVASFWVAVPLLWRLASDGNDSAKTKWALAVAAGAMLGVAVASKETWVLMAAAAAAGAGVAFAGEFRAARHGWRETAKGIGWQYPAVFAGAAVLVAEAFFSSFGKNPAGVVDSVMTYTNYINKTSGGPHDKPFAWYFPLLFDIKPVARDVLVALGLERFARSIGLGGLTGTREILAGLGSLLALAMLPVRSAWSGQTRRLAVFFLVSGVTLFFLYSSIAYKTPWLMLGVLPPLWMASGLGVAALWRWVTGRACAAPDAAGAADSGGLKQRQCFWVPGIFFSAALLAAGVFQWNAAKFLSRRFAADERNPLAYVHATGDVKRLTGWLEQLEPLSKEYPLLLRVHLTEYWPLPWYARRWVGKVGFWRGGPTTTDDALDAPVVITDEQTEAAVAPRLREKYHEDFLGLRPGVLLRVRLNEDLLRQALKLKEKNAHE
ncbi:MAG: TIGR03663 family protein [Puniceicoccales bacterium]|jgi:uncharacterized protein (TIGR03663 family)|nr:TIGR03663 family protein [Puniceicoccales bacterium]